MVDQYHMLGISASYARVTQLESDIASSLCKQFESDGVVCPSNLRKGLFTVGVVDNLDHNTSSTTAQSSFHDTGISIIQFPTSDFIGDCRDAVPFIRGESEVSSSLPQSYSTVPAVSLNASVPEKCILSSLAEAL